MSIQKDYYLPLYVGETTIGCDILADMADYDNVVIIDTEQQTTATGMSINVRDEYVRAVIDKMGNERLHVTNVYINLFKAGLGKISILPRVGDTFPAMTRNGNFYYSLSDFGRAGCSFYTNSYGEYAKLPRRTVHIELRTYRRSDGIYDTVAYVYPHHELKLATHNSLTFSKVKHTLDEVFDDEFNRCQSLNLQQQYALGVRMFDFRFRQDGDSGRPLIAHGRVEYEGDVESYLSYLNTLPNVTVRLMLENQNFAIDRRRKRDYGWYGPYVSGLLGRYKNIHFCGGISKYGGDKVAADVPDEPYINQLIDKSKNDFDPTHPHDYAVANNWNNRTQINYTTWTMFDFVELCFQQP